MIRHINNKCQKSYHELKKSPYWLLTLQSNVIIESETYSRKYKFSYIHKVRCTSSILCSLYFVLQLRGNRTLQMYTARPNMKIFLPDPILSLSMSVLTHATYSSISVLYFPLLFCPPRDMHTNILYAFLFPV
jgi:hypothetical protein